MPKFRKKPVVIDAVRWTGDNVSEIEALGAKFYREADLLFIPTLEGEMTANAGDWIIKGIKGEFYPCKNDIFEKSYEPCGEQAVAS